MEKLEAVAHVQFSDNGNIRMWAVKEHPLPMALADGTQANPDPLCKLSDAEAIIAAKDAEYTTLAQNGGRQLSRLREEIAAKDTALEIAKRALLAQPYSSGAERDKKMNALAVIDAAMKGGE